MDARARPRPALLLRRQLVLRRGRAGGRRRAGARRPHPPRRDAAPRECCRRPIRSGSSPAACSGRCRPTSTRTSTTTTCATGGAGSRSGPLSSCSARGAPPPIRGARGLNTPDRLYNGSSRGDQACCGRDRCRERLSAGDPPSAGALPFPRTSARCGCCPRASRCGRSSAGSSASPRSSPSTSRGSRRRSTSRSSLREVYYGERPDPLGAALGRRGEVAAVPLPRHGARLLAGRPLPAARAARRRRAGRLLAPARDRAHARLRDRHRLPAHDLRPLRRRRSCSARSSISLLRSSYEIVTADMWRVAGARRRAMLVGERRAARLAAPRPRARPRRDRLRVRRRPLRATSDGRGRGRAAAARPARATSRACSSASIRTS